MYTVTDSTRSRAWSPIDAGALFIPPFPSATIPLGKTETPTAYGASECHSRYFCMEFPPRHYVHPRPLTRTLAHPSPVFSSSIGSSLRPTFSLPSIIMCHTNRRRSFNCARSTAGSTSLGCISLNCPYGESHNAPVCPLEAIFGNKLRCVGQNLVICRASMSSSFLLSSMNITIH